MNVYLARLRALNLEKPIPEQLPKLSKPSYGSFGSSRSIRFSERAAIFEMYAALEERGSGPGTEHERRENASPIADAAVLARLKARRFSK
jgi:hypothetical protein